MNKLIAVFATFVALLPPAATAQSMRLQQNELSSGAGTSPITYALKSDDDIQHVLDSYSTPETVNDVIIVVPSTYTYRKTIVLRNRSTSNWITVRSEHTFNPKVRVAPNDAANMFHLVATGSDPAIETDQTKPSGTSHPGAAHHYRFIGMDVTSTAALTWNLILLGTTRETALEDLPHDIYIANSYIHGAQTGEMVRGILICGGNMELDSNYIAGFKSTFMESNAVGVANGADNFTIDNNYLEGAAENLIFDGDGESIRNLVPSNIRVTHNYFYKPLTWRDLRPAVFVKNLLEFKNGQNIVIDHNLFENNWAQNQSGAAILFTARTQYGADPLNTVSDVTFTNNIVRHAVTGINMLGYDDLSNGLPLSSLVRSHNYLIDHNLFDDLSANKYGPGQFAVGVQVIGPPDKLTVSNNTFQYAAGENRQPMGFWLVGQSDLWGTTWDNNLFNAEVGGDSRVGSMVLTWQPNQSDPQYPYQSQLRTPPVFAPTNVILETNPNYQAAWNQAVPGIRFAAKETSGANLGRLSQIEQQTRQGVYK